MSGNTTMNGGDESAPFPPPLVHETLQYRLVTGNIAKQGGQRGSLTRCAQKYGIFQTRLTASTTSNDSSAEAIEGAKEELVQELELYQLELTKLTLLQQQLEAQVQQNHQAEADRGRMLTTLRQEVQTSQAQATQSQDVQSSFLEYEALAKLINDHHPESTCQLQENLDQVQSEVHEWKQEEAVLDQLLSVRQGQFQLLMQYMLDLKRTLNDTEEDTRSIRLAEEQVKRRGEKGATKDKENAVSMVVDEEEGLYGDL